MATSALILGETAAPRRRGAARRLGVPRGATNGAPCLGLALAAGGLARGALGAALTGLARLLT
jgi:hypothetical protein